MRHAPEKVVVMCSLLDLRQSQVCDNVLSYDQLVALGAEPRPHKNATCSTTFWRFRTVSHQARDHEAFAYAAKCRTIRETGEGEKVLTHSRPPAKLSPPRALHTSYRP